jgi:pyruvate/2-oxoglutarate/acetoin dehydrogenase E1 component
MGKYFDEMCRTMTWLGKQPDTFFLGQAVEYSGTVMTTTLKGVPKEKMMEFPVNEDMQLGMSIGMSLTNTTIPISIFPRWNFFLLATNQLVNHLDKISMMADNPYTPKVIIRVGVGSERPLHPQHQHVGDYSEAFRLLCPRINIIQLKEPEQIFPEYVKAYENVNNSTILVEWGDYYVTK